MRGRSCTQPFLVEKGRTTACRPNGIFLLPRWANRSPPHQSPSVTASPPPKGKPLGCAALHEKESQIRARTWAPKQPHDRPAAPHHAKTSERERAGPKSRGARGQSPRRSFLRLSPEKAGLPPGVGREPTSQVLTCKGPRRDHLPIRQPPHPTGIGKENPP